MSVIRVEKLHTENFKPCTNEVEFQSLSKNRLQQELKAKIDKSRLYNNLAESLDLCLKYKEYNKYQKDLRSKNNIILKTFHANSKEKDKDPKLVLIERNERNDIDKLLASSVLSSYAKIRERRKKNAKENFVEESKDTTTLQESARNHKRQLLFENFEKIKKTSREIEMRNEVQNESELMMKSNSTYFTNMYLIKTKDELKKDIYNYFNLKRNPDEDKNNVNLKTNTQSQSQEKNSVAKSLKDEIARRVCLFPSKDAKRNTELEYDYLTLSEFHRQVKSGLYKSSSEKLLKTKNNFHARTQMEYSATTNVNSLNFNTNTNTNHSKESLREADPTRVDFDFGLPRSLSKHKDSIRLQTRLNTTHKKQLKTSLAFVCNSTKPTITFKRKSVLADYSKKLSKKEKPDTQTQNKLTSEERYQKYIKMGFSARSQMMRKGYLTYLNNIKLTSDLKKKKVEVLFLETESNEEEETKDSAKNLVDLIINEITKKKKPNKQSRIYKQLELAEKMTFGRIAPIHSIRTSKKK